MKSFLVVTEGRSHVGPDIVARVRVDTEEQARNMLRSEPLEVLEALERFINESAPEDFFEVPDRPDYPLHLIRLGRGFLR